MYCKDLINFKIKDKKLVFISDYVNNAINTVAEMDNQYYYLGSDEPDLNSAVRLYESVFGKLSKEELRFSLENNVFETKTQGD